MYATIRKLLGNKVQQVDDRTQIITKRLFILHQYVLVLFYPAGKIMNSFKRCRIFLYISIYYTIYNRMANERGLSKLKVACKIC